MICIWLSLTLFIYNSLYHNWCSIKLFTEYLSIYNVHTVRSEAGLCIYHLFVISNLIFLHISSWITLPTQSCLVLYFFRANLLHSLIMWLIVSSLLQRNLHFLFCCVLSILAMIWLVLVALFCTAIKRDSVSSLKFPCLIHVHVFCVWCFLVV